MQCRTMLKFEFQVQLLAEAQKWPKCPTPRVTFILPKGVRVGKGSTLYPGPDKGATLNYQLPNSLSLAT